MATDEAGQSNVSEPVGVTVYPESPSIEVNFATGSAGANYALERSFRLAPPSWLPQATNPANSFGALVFTSHRGLASFAAVLTVGVVAGLVLSLFLLPQVLRLAWRGERPAAA